MDEDEDLYIKKTKPPYSPDLHLKTAIKSYEREMFLSGISNEDKPIQFLVSKSVRAYNNSLIRISSGRIRIDSEFTYGHLLNPQLTRTGKGAKYLREHDSNLELSKSILISAIGSLFTHLQEFSSDKSNLIRKIQMIEPSPTIKQWFVYRNFWEAMRDNMKDRQVRDDYAFRDFSSEMFPYPIIGNAYFLLITMPENNTTWVLDYSQVLLISDTVGSRFLSLLYVSIHEVLDISPMPTVENMLSFYRIGDRVISSLGNPAYDFIKQIEPICIASYLKRYEELPISQRFYSQLLEACGSNQPMRAFLTDLFHLIGDIGNHPLKLIELFGCFRHFGHPTVDELAGIESLRENSRLNIEIDESQLQKVTGAFKRMFILEFIAQKKRWPKCRLLDTTICK
nr:MAG: RNA-dependent RNA polymerase [Riboviria sp.]